MQIIRALRADSYVFQMYKNNFLSLNAKNFSAKDKGCEIFYVTQ